MASPTVVFVLHDAGGTVPPVLAVAAEVVRRGGRAVVVSQPSVRARAEAVGARFDAFRTLPDYDPTVELEAQLDVLGAAVAGEEIATELADAVTRHRADVVVVDPDLASSLVAARSSGVPSAVLLHRFWATCTDVWFSDVWPLVADEIDRVRRGVGLPTATGWGDLVAEHDLVIAPVPASFDAPSSVPPPPTIHHVGFLVPPSPVRVGAVETHGAEPTERCDVATDPAPAGDGPLVLVGSSTTFQDQESVLRTVTASLGSLRSRGVRAVVTTSGHADPRHLDPAPNVSVVAHHPHVLLLPTCAAMVTHGGMGSVAAALHHGVPLVCTPIARDQHLVAERVVTCGAGIVVEPSDDERAVTAAIRDVLDDPAYRDAARRLAHESALAGGPAGTVEALVRLTR